MTAAEVAKLALTPHEVEQLIGLKHHSITAAGDLVSHDVEQRLREKGLAARMGGYSVVTRAGEAWLRMAHLIVEVRDGDR